AVAHHDPLDERVADPLRGAALDLAARERRVDGLADLLHRRHADRPNLEGVAVQLDLGDVAAPGERRVGVAAIGLLVPLNPGRLDVFLENRDWTVRPV